MSPDSVTPLTGIKRTQTDEPGVVVPIYCQKEQVSPLNLLFSFFDTCNLHDLGPPLVLPFIFFSRAQFFFFFLNINNKTKEGLQIKGWQRKSEAEI